MLQLSGVNPTLSTFSARPQRSAGTLTVHEFPALWSGGVFRHDPPNAAVVVGESVWAVELLGAVWDPAADTLWLAVDPLVSDAGAAEALPSDPDVVSGGPVQVFIDGFPAPVNTQVDDSATQADVSVIGEPPAESMGSSYKSMAQISNLGLLEARSSVDMLTGE